jgi:hypothetical protein
MPQESDPADNVVPFQPQPSGMDFIVQQRQQAQAGAITSLDDSADDAARANDLSDATGTPPALVYGDLENFEKQHKAALTSQLLQNNGYLRDYVNSHPLAAKISNDDWGNLDSASQAFQKLKQPDLKFENTFASSEFAKKWTAAELNSNDAPWIKWPLVATGTLGAFASGAVESVQAAFASSRRSS